MFKLPKRPMNMADLQPTWEYLVRQERALQRNNLICRIIQPVGAVICAWNMLLVSVNLWLFLAGDKIAPYFAKLPVLPSLISSMPQSGTGKVLLFSLLMVFALPLSICGLIAGVFYFIAWYKYRQVQEPLNGSPLQKAVALRNKAENVYEIRRKMPSWSVYLESAILTAITAVPIVLMFVDYASEGTMVLTLAVLVLILLFVLVASYWLYALVLYTFSKLNSLLYLSAGKWKLYELCFWVRDYSTLVDEQYPERRYDEN